MPPSCAVTSASSRPQYRPSHDRSAASPITHRVNQGGGPHSTGFSRRAAELGPLLRQASWVAGQLVEADQVYNCLWSHLGGRPGHIHYVVQPVTREQMAAYGALGPSLQVAMSQAQAFPDEGEVARVAEQARWLFAVSPPAGGSG